MKITKKQLEQMIKEAVEAQLKEAPTEMSFDQKDFTRNVKMTYTHGSRLVEQLEEILYILAGPNGEPSGGSITSKYANSSKDRERYMKLADLKEDLNAVLESIKTNLHKF